MKRNARGQRFGLYFRIGFKSRIHKSPVSWLNELVLLCADYEHRTWRGAHDPLGRATDAQMPPACIAVGGDDDEIDIELLGGLGDLVRRMPDPYERTNRMCAVTVRLGREHGQILFCRRKLIFIGEYFDGERRANHGGYRFDDVEQCDLATELLRESQSVLNCSLRCLGEIGGDENFFQVEDLRDQFN